MEPLRIKLSKIYGPPDAQLLTFLASSPATSNTEKLSLRSVILGEMPTF